MRENCTTHCFCFGFWYAFVDDDGPGKVFWAHTRKKTQIQIERQKLIVIVCSHVRILERRKAQLNEQRRGRETVQSLTIEYALAVHPITGKNSNAK